MAQSGGATLPGLRWNQGRRTHWVYREGTPVEQQGHMSRETFEQLVARAIELDEAGRDRIELAQARAIARDLGVSDEAWAAALREREASPSRAASIGGHGVDRRLGLVALAGLVGGAAAGALAPVLGDGVLPLGGAAVAAAGVIFARHRRRGVRAAHAALATWWLSLAAGIMAGIGDVHGDPLAFATASWAGCAAAGAALDRIRRRRGGRPAPDVVGTA